MANALDGLKIDWLPNGHRVVTISAEKLRKVRREAGLTQKELAEKAGLSRHFLPTVEREDDVHRLTTILKLAKTLGVAARELQGESTG